ncbi:MBL fold metallo-hydrolase [Pseudofrankia inefficax]|uniref:Beta-lactamase domain protein n=1 Tax=Pseudofrankia inefficax (strain DSM 45817 / CECT 9037 / DDB 130130 / EuI1c) TaxID=298654 RepID=E3J8R2_PSEI1|nr:MBL fold metallo-hydrolase [Pseudofrankia inefficax]ADP78505.1 beta-lactamase domain protein [Pseudofrankia inefficax]
MPTPPNQLADRNPAAAPDAARLEEVRPGVHAWVQPDGSWWVNNAGAVGGAEGLLVIDTCATADRTQRFLTALADATGGAPIRLAVNTHQHGDHTYGNSLLPAATVLIGHEEMREGLRTDFIIDGCPAFWAPVPDWGPIERRLPDVAITASTTVYVGERRVDLLHPGGPAHTTGDLVAWLPDDRVLFAGDLVFAGLTPLVFMGSVTGALAAVDWLADLEPEVIVPGHGPVLVGGEIDRVLNEHRRYYEFVLALAEGGLARGATPLEVAGAVDLGEFAGWADAERLVLNLHRDYADRAGQEIDLVAALCDAVTWLGHPMPTSV